MRCGFLGTDTHADTTVRMRNKIFARKEIAIRFITNGNDAFFHIERAEVFLRLGSIFVFDIDASDRQIGLTEFGCEIFFKERFRFQAF